MLINRLVSCVMNDVSQGSVLFHIFINDLENIDTMLTGFRDHAKLGRIANMSEDKSECKTDTGE